MSDLREAAEMVLKVYDNDYGEMSKKIALADLRKALKPPVKSYCGGKPNYCTEPEEWVKKENAFWNLAWEVGYEAGKNATERRTT